MKKISFLMLLIGLVLIFFCGECQPAADTTEKKFGSKIIFPDMNNARIVIMDDMKGTNRRNITTIGSYTLKNPSWVEKDSKNDVIYVLDSTSASSNDSVIVRITGLDESVSTKAIGSKIDLYNASWTNPWIHGPTQLAIALDGSIIIAELQYFSTLTQSRLLKLDGFTSPGISSTISPATYLSNGVTVLPDGTILRSKGKAYDFGDPLYAVGIDKFNGFTLSGASSFGTYANGNGSNELRLPSSIIYHSIFDVIQYIYLTDSENNRLVRFNLDGSGRKNYQPMNGASPLWNNPRMVAVLPEDRILVEDTGNDKLYLVDNAFSGSPSYTSYDGGADPFDFDFYYQYS